MTPLNYQAYNRSAVQSTNNKEEILLRLYEGAIKFIRLAQRGIREKNMECKAKNISKVMAILTEFECALDMENGGGIAENLSALYHYMKVRLSEANIANNMDILEEVAGLLTELKEGFEFAAKQLTQKPTVSQPDLQARVQKGVRFAV